MRPAESVSRPARVAARGGHVLITGATGALGRVILRRVAETLRPARVTLLIRGRDEPSIRARVNDLTRSIARGRPGLDLAMVTAVRAELRSPGLGMHPSIQDELLRTVSHVIHGAATVRLTLPLAQARETNVLGTEAILRFAGRCTKLVRLVHVSTAYVAGNRSGRIAEDELDCGQEFLNTYERSKFEAEQLVRQRMSDLPITVLRPSIIVAGPEDGHAISLGSLLPVLRHVASGRLRDLPGRGSTPVDFVPVEHVSNIAVRALGAPAGERGTYHVTAGEERALTARGLMEMTIREAGRHPERAIRFDGEHPGFSDPSNRRLRERLDCYFRYLYAGKIFETSRLERLLGSADPPCPHPREYLPRLLRGALAGAATTIPASDGAGARSSASAPGGAW